VHAFEVKLYIPVVFKLLVWCGAEGYVSGLQDAALLAVLWHVWCGWLKARWKRGFRSFEHCLGISLPAWWRDWMYNCSKYCNKNLCCINLAFYFHIWSI